MEEVTAHKNLPSRAEYYSVLEQELKNIENFKKNVPESIAYKLNNFQKYSEIMDNIFRNIICDASLLFCVEKMLVAEDHTLEFFPQSALNTLGNFIETDVQSGEFNQTLASGEINKSYPEFCIATTHVLKYITNNNLKKRILQYSGELSYIEKKLLACLHRFRQICLDRVNEYKNNIYLSTEYFQNLFKANENYKRKIKELQTEHRITVNYYKNEIEFHQQKLNFVKVEERMARDMHLTQLHNERVKMQPIIQKTTKALVEERNQCLQSLDNIKNLYENTLLKDQKKCKQLQETRYKRETAVKKMIEKFDRDYSKEHGRLEHLNKKHQELTEKSKQLDAQIESNIRDFYYIHLALERQIKAFRDKRRNRMAAKIQKWWQNVLFKKYVSGSSMSLKPKRNLSAPPSQHSVLVHRASDSSSLQKESRSKEKSGSKHSGTLSMPLMNYQVIEQGDDISVHVRASTTLHPMIESGELASIAGQIPLKKNEKGKAKKPKNKKKIF